MGPKVKLEIGFGSDPTVPLASTSWTDVTQYLLGVPSGSNGGRVYELDRAEAGKMKVVLNNKDRRFEPEYASSPYYPNVVPLRRVRLTLGENYVTNPSFATDAASWGSGATFSVARSTAQALIGAGSLKSTFISGSVSTDMADSLVTLPSAGRYAFSTYIYIPAAWNGGLIVINAESFTGATEVTAARHDADMSKRDQWQRIWRVFDVVGSDLAGSVAVRCITFPTSGTPFVYIDGVQSAVVDSNNQLQPYVDRPYEKYTGFIEEWPPAYETRWSSVTVDCIDGFEPLAQANLAGGVNRLSNPSFETDASGWAVVNGTLTRDTARSAAGAASGKLTAHATLNSDIRPTGITLEGKKYYAANAKIWIPSGLGITPANVKMGFGLLSGGEQLVVAQALFDQWQTLIAPVFYTVDGGETNTFGKTSFGNSSKVRFDADMKAASPYTLSESGVIFRVTAELDRNYEDFQVAPGQQIQAFVCADTAGSPGALLGTSRVVTVGPQNPSWIDFEFDTPVAVPAGTYWLGIIGGTIGRGCFYYYDVGVGKMANRVDAFSDGPSNPFGSASQSTNNLAIYATYTAGVVAFDGYFVIRLNETGASKFINVDEVMLREVTAAEAELIDPAGSDMSKAQVGLRMHRALSVANVPVQDRLIDAGTSTVADETISTDSDFKVLSELHADADADLGIFFCNAKGQVVFHGRSRRFNPVPIASFTDRDGAPGVFVYEDLKPSFDKAKIANDIRVSAAVGERQVTTDKPSQDRYMPRTFSKSLQLSDEQQALVLSQAILNRKKDPHLRFETMDLSSIAEESCPGLVNAMLAAEVSDCYTVQLNPPGGGAVVSRNVHLEKQTWKVEVPAVFKAKWQLSPVDPTTYWTVEDPVHGAPDQNGVAF